MTDAVHEEKVNAATHGFGFACATVAAIVLLTTATRLGGRWQIAGCAVYVATLVAAYAASTLSHLFTDLALRRAFRIADQAVIFLFIAGTYTPVSFSWLRTPGWWGIFATEWAIALIGFGSKALFAHRVHVGAVSVALYVLLGCLPMFAFGPMYRAIPHPLMGWLWAGGACYLAGIVFFTYDYRVRYFHAAWHVLVLAGSACHYLGILLYCTAAPR
jgi:hemolysin III